MVHVSCRIQVGAHSYPFAWRLYLRAKTVRRLNQTRPKEERLRFKSKYRLAHEMLQDLKAQLPEGWAVYVLVDSWYASTKLLKFIHRQGWQSLCAIQSNHTLNGTKLSEWNRRLKHQRYTSAEVSTASGKRTTFLTHKVCGRLKNLPLIRSRNAAVALLLYFLAREAAQLAAGWSSLCPRCWHQKPPDLCCTTAGARFEGPINAPDSLLD